MSAGTGIPTVFDGVEYRSRLEAKWASFFRKIDWDFTYEPFDGNGYIPDFAIHGDRPMLVEVKPAVSWAQYKDAIPKSVKGLRGVWDGDILIVGVNPFPGFDSVHAGYPVAGLLGELMGDCGCSPEELAGGSHASGDPFECPKPAEEWWFERAPWCECPRGGDVAVVHEFQSFRHRPCDHYDGSWGSKASALQLGKAWAEATNEVKWKGRSR